MFSCRTSFDCLVCFVIFATFCCGKNIAAVDELKRACPERCNLAFRCDPYYSGPPVWTIADDYCKLFKTDCLFASENCQRQTKCLPKIIKTTEEECKQHCLRPCTTTTSDSSICAGFPYRTANGGRHDEMLTFANQCELDNFACLNGKAYLYASDGACVPQ